MVNGNENRPDFLYFCPEYLGATPQSLLSPSLYPSRNMYVIFDNQYLNVLYQFSANINSA